MSTTPAETTPAETTLSTALSTTRRACYFRLAEQTLAVTSAYLRQIVPVGSVTPVPGVGPELLGLFTVRGAVVPLIDLRPLLGFPTPGRAGTLAALCEYGAQPLALSLDEVLGFLPYQSSAPHEQTPELRAFSGETTTYGELTAAVIDVGRVMGALERRLVV